MDDKIKDGGPAFPVSTGDPHKEYQNGPCTAQFPGMALRDYFAGQALQGLIANLTYGGELQRIFDRERALADAGEKAETPHQYVGRITYSLADAMLKARAA